MNNLPMLGFLERFRSVFSTNSPNLPKPIADGIEIIEATTFSILTAQYGFYTTLLGDIDDKKPLTVPQKLVQSIVETALNDKQKRIAAVPRLPSVIPKLLHSLRDPTASASDYVNIINKDPAMSTVVLKLANSVYFNPIAKRISNIETAVVKLGIDGLRTVLSAAVMQPVIERNSNYYTSFGHKLWQHSLCCAVACEIIAKQRGLEPYKAYLLGLVHDIGKITIFSELSNQFQINKEQEGEPGYAAFAPMMQSFSEQLSHTIVTDWEFPDDIRSALEQQINLTAQQQVGPYAHVLFQANIACEIYAMAQHDSSQLAAATQALADMSLPKNLFEQLNSVTMEL